MNCPECGERMKCIDSRPGKHGSEQYVRRRFVCACNVRVSTMEVIVINSKKGQPFPITMERELIDKALMNMRK